MPRFTNVLKLNLGLADLLLVLGIAVIVLLNSILLASVNTKRRSGSLSNHSYKLPASAI